MFTSMQVNSNGVLSFGFPFNQHSPSVFPLSSTDILIAPFWIDINIEIAGRIYYRFSNDVALLNQAQSLILDSAFSPSLLFIATWDRVAQFNGVSSEVSTLNCFSS